MRAGHPVLVAVALKLLKDAGEERLDRADGFLRLDAQGPIEAPERRQPGELRIALADHQQLVHAVVLARFDQLLGELDRDRGAQ